MKNWISLFILFSIVSLRAQQQFLFSQNKIAPVVFNPACTGAPSEITGIVLHRTQWSNLDNAPVTSLISVHAPIDYYRMGIGARIMNDEFFDFKTLSANLLLSYKIKIRNGFFSVGMSPGLKQFGYNQEHVNPNDLSDPNYVALQNRWVKFDLASGAFLFTKRTSIGVSIQKTFATPKEINQPLEYSFLMHGSHVIPLSQRNGLRISGQSRFAFSTSLTEGTVSLENKNYWFGAGVRTNMDILVISGLDLKSLIPTLRHNLKVAYALDLNVGSVQLSSRPAHELALVASIKRIKNKSEVKPSGNHLRIL